VSVADGEGASGRPANSMSMMRVAWDAPPALSDVAGRRLRRPHAFRRRRKVGNDGADVVLEIFAFDGFVVERCECLRFCLRPE
jgi:hypothetical protein